VEVVASAPGKVFVLGEYAVTLGAPAIVAASERRLSCRARSRAGRGRLTVTAGATRFEGDLHTDGVRGAFALDGVPPGCRFVVAAARSSAVTLDLRSRDVDLETWSELEAAGSRAKPGLGGSAAAVASTVAAMFALAGCETGAATRRQRLALGIAAHRAAQGGGSGGDVVAATYGGLSCIRGLDASAASNPTVDSLGDLDVRTVELPSALSIDVVASGSSASTGPRVARFLERARSPRTSRLVEAWVDGTGAAVEGFLAACGRGDAEGALRAVALARELLGRLGASAGIPVWSAGLRRACGVLAGRSGLEIKPSGAGGGDCAVALVRSGLRDELRAAWLERGLEPIGSAGAAPGVSVSIEREAARV